VLAIQVFKSNNYPTLEFVRDISLQFKAIDHMHIVKRAYGRQTLSLPFS